MTLLLDILGIALLLGMVAWLWWPRKREPEKEEVWRGRRWPRDG